MSNTKFGFTKLLVNDLEASAAFYTSVCGLAETGRVEASIAGRNIREILFAPAHEGSATFVLLKFLDAPKPANDEVILGFMTDDVDAFVERAKAAGGAVAQPAYSAVEHGVKVAFVTDVEGHLIEVVQLL
ncbi:VOC family protein [Archangium lipolyticum]|uniref:VOC family protein n=1 Tax=Archangium lipolyticum TaxID=2970465 RepID=UPI00214A7C61|nr:VOC family protein [Archangium lipolyticum]